MINDIIKLCRNGYPKNRHGSTRETTNQVWVALLYNQREMFHCYCEKNCERRD